MKKRLKVLGLTLSVILTAAYFAACGDVQEFKYYSYDQGTQYNKELFFQNELTLVGADPSCLYITEGEEQGYFYMYITSDVLGGRGYQAYRSKDLANWEYVKDAFMPELNSWGVESLWAPQPVYDPSDETYYLFYSAQNSNQADGYEAIKYMGLATSKNPYGPFEQWTGTDGNGRDIGIGDPIFDFRRMPAGILYGEDVDPLTDIKYSMSAIDVCPFIDPVSGEYYLYFVKSREGKAPAPYGKGESDDPAAQPENQIWVVKMKDKQWHTPDYTTVKQLTSVEKTTPNGDIPTNITSQESKIDEGPYVTYRNGKYYMFFSVGATTSPAYAVCQAVSDSPGEGFVKLTKEEGGVVNSVTPEWTDISCAGGGVFVEAGDETYLVYHQHIDASARKARAVAANKAVWVDSGKGYEILHVNGPTKSPQPLPEIAAKFKNLIQNATVTAKGGAADTDVKYLSDNLIRMHAEYDSYVPEFAFAAGKKQTITVEFDSYQTVKAIMIYAGYEFDRTFRSVDVTFDILSNAKKGSVKISGLKFDLNRYSDYIYDAEYGIEDGTYIYTGAAAIAEFEEVSVKKIVFTFDVPQGGSTVNEIVILGKEG